MKKTFLTIFVLTIGWVYGASASGNTKTSSLNCIVTTFRAGVDSGAPNKVILDLRPYCQDEGGNNCTLVGEYANDSLGKFRVQIAQDYFDDDGYDKSFARISLYQLEHAERTSEVNPVQQLSLELLMPITRKPTTLTVSLGVLDIRSVERKMQIICQK